MGGTIANLSVGHPSSASAASPMRGGKLVRAVDTLYEAQKLRDTAQEVLNHLPHYAL
jgi:hypothetical protein